MQNKKKRIVRFFILLIMVIVGVGLAVKFLPLHILMTKYSIPESAFINQEKIRNTAMNTLVFDFEVNPESTQNKGLYKGIAHSGIYSAKAFGKKSCTFTIERKAGDIGLENLKAIALSAWIFVFSGKKRGRKFSCLLRF